MLRRTIIGGFLAMVFLAGIFIFHQLRDDRRAHIAESLLIVRPFNNALLTRAFEREVRRSSPGIARLGFLQETTMNGAIKLTNGVIRLVTTGVTGADAERLANSAAQEVCALLDRRYGIRAAPIGPALGVSSSALGPRPSWLRFGNATPGYFPTSGRVFFPKPAISLDPGGGWMRAYNLLREPEQDVSLLGQGKFKDGFISAFRFGPQITNVQSAVEVRRRSLERTEGFIESSWKEEPFATEGGLHGVHTSFMRQYPAPFRGGTVLMPAFNHEYLVTNAQSRCVGIGYLDASSSSTATPGSRSDEVQTMIRRTLRTE